MTPEAVRQARTAGAEPTGEGGRPEAAWPAAIALVAVLALQVALPERLVPGSRWILPALETALLLPLVLGARYRHHTEARWARVLVIALVAVTNAANVYALILLAYYLIRGTTAPGHQLILSSIYIWFTNVVIFGLWYWELDRGGPGARTRPVQPPPEFLYPQMLNPEVAPRHWRPTFVDYLYVSLTNATAFSPTDTLPLSRRMKALMAVQAMASLLTVALVAARAVNILS